MKRVAISLGDLNGIGLEIALRAHQSICEFCTPYYAISPKMLSQGAKKLGLEVSTDINLIACEDSFSIKAGIPTKKSGKASYNSFASALKFVKQAHADALVTLPINKVAWNLAGVPFIGHTDALGGLLKEEAMMMLGCEELFVGLYTHHIRLKEVSKKVKKEPLYKFLLNFQKATKSNKIGVLGLNPHAGDNGVLGEEDFKIAKAIKSANQTLGSEIFFGPLVPDVAFTAQNRKDFTHFVCMYHDQGLIPLKALYFDEAINVSLGLSVIRTSVDHGTAYDKAYKSMSPNLNSYLNAIKYAIKLASF